MEELKRDDLFEWKNLMVDKVADMIQQEPWRTKEILDFISYEMKREVEFNEKLDLLKHEYEKKKKELYKEYEMVLDD